MNCDIKQNLCILMFQLNAPLVQDIPITAQLFDIKYGTCTVYEWLDSLIQ